MNKWGSSPQTVDFKTQVVEPLQSLMAQVVGFIPTLVVAAGIVLIGWVVSLGIREIIKKFLMSIHFDQIAENTGIAQVLSENKIGMTPSVWVSRIFYWFGVFLSWLLALDRLCLKIPFYFFKNIGDFFSVLFMALFMLLIGLFFSVVISSFVETTARKLKIPAPGLHAAVIRWAVILVTFAAVLSRLGYPLDYLLIALSAIGITLCITFVIAVGIGSIPSVPKVLDRIMEK